MAIDSDLIVKTAWGLTLTQWQNLTDDQRRYYRDNVAHAVQEAKP